MITHLLPTPWLQRYHNLVPQVQESQEGDETHIEKKKRNSLENSLQEGGADWHGHHAETCGIQFHFKEKVLLCTVIIFWVAKVLQFQIYSMHYN